MDTPRRPRAGDTPAPRASRGDVDTTSHNPTPGAPQGVPRWAVIAPLLIAVAMWIGWQFGPGVALIIGLVGVIALIVWRVVVARRARQSKNSKGDKRKGQERRWTRRGGTTTRSTYGGPGGDDWPHPDEYEPWPGWVDGWVDVSAAAADAPRVECAAGDGVVPWRELRWEPVVEDGRVAVSAAVPAFHRRCRRRAVRREFLAGLRALAGFGRITVVEAVVPSVDVTVRAWAPVAVAVVQGARRVGAEVERAGREAVRVHGRDAWRWVRSVRLEAVGRPAGNFVGRAWLAADRARAAVVVAVGKRRPGVDSAGRQYHDDPVGAVVAPEEFDRWGFRAVGGRVEVYRSGRQFGEPAGRFHLATPGEAGPTARDVGDWVDADREAHARGERLDLAAWQRERLGQWFGNDRPGGSPRPGTDGR